MVFLGSCFSKSNSTVHIKVHVQVTYTCTLYMLHVLVHVATFSTFYCFVLTYNPMQIIKEVCKNSTIHT